MPSCRGRPAGSRAAGGTLGLRRESRIILLLPDTVEFLIAFWGAIRTGIVAIALKQPSDNGAIRLHL